MTEYEFGSDVFTVDNGWFEVWARGESRGRGALRSWPRFVSYLKTAEYFDGAGWFRKMRKMSDMQEELEKRYELIQQEALDAAPDGLSVAVQLPPFPDGTPMSKQTIRADYVAAIGIKPSPTSEPLDRAEAVAAAEEGAAELGEDLMGAEVAEREMLGHATVVLAATARDDDGTLRAAQRTAVVVIDDHPVYAQVVVRTSFEGAVAHLGATLDGILDGAELVLPSAD